MQFDGASDGPGRLPMLPSAFVGRVDLLARLRSELGCQRLLTLTGAGGVGKTRLAIEAARALSAAGSCASAFVDLAPLREASQVIPAVAAALKVPDEPGRSPIESIAATLGARPLLLVLDNCEHLPDGCATAATALLAACPGLTLLATSRERLRLDGEHVIDVPPLALPDAAADAEALAASEAGALFLDRAHARRVDLALSGDGSAAVVEICRRLDGLPLAIELAAARVGLLSPRQIAVRLDDRFRLLVNGRRDAPARQQTLRTTLDWSYALLSADEQAAFRRLSVFPADFDLDAAAAICATGEATLDLVGRLIETSLVQAIDHGTERRYRLLENLRVYGHERLQAADEADETLLRHADYFLREAEAEQQRSSAPTDPRWLQWLKCEYANLHAAIAWLCDSERTEAALRLLNAVFRFWSYYGGAQDGDHLLQPLLARLGDVSAAVRARTLSTAVFLARDLGEAERARGLLNSAEALYRELGDDYGLAAMLNMRAVLAYESGDDEGARQGHEAGLAHARARGEQRMELLHLTNLALAQLALGQCAEAQENTEAALSIARQTADGFAIALCIGNLGAIAYGAGDLDAAAEQYKRSREAAEPIGSSRLLAVTDDRLSHVPRRRGAYGEAAELLLRSLATSVAGDSRVGIAETVASAAMLAVDAERPTEGASLWALTCDLLDRLRLGLVSIYRADFARCETLLLARLGQAELSRLREEARSIGWDEAIAQTRAVLTALREEHGTPAAPLVAGRVSVSGGPWALTEREHEVLCLLAAGRSNKEIAAALVLSVRTVERHIENIYAKTGARGRAAITQYALSHKLV